MVRESRYGILAVQETLHYQYFVFKRFDNMPIVSCVFKTFHWKIINAQCRDCMPDTYVLFVKTEYGEETVQTTNAPKMKCSDENRSRYAKQ
jgi:hypothetical protein